ncbi:MAG: hypothetical protein ACE5JM_14050, partial [Armatimonadota bacterium]
SHEQITARIKKTSEETLKRFFVVEAIAEAEGIEVSDEEVEAEVTRIAEQENRIASALREELEAQDRIEPIRLRLREDKVVALLVESANVTEAPAEEQGSEPEPEEAEDADGEDAAQ